MSLPWKQYARGLRERLAVAVRRQQFWEGMAKGRVDMEAIRERDQARIDAFAGWMDARILQRALEQALILGTFDVQTRISLEKDLVKVNFEDPEQFLEDAN